MAENKTKATNVSVGGFVGALPDERRADAKAIMKLLQAATGEKPKMWGPSIIGFGTLHYVYDSGREGDICMVGFSPRKAANVFYGLGGRAGASPLLKKLGKFTTGKGCLYIKKLADVDEKVLTQLVKKSVADARAK